MTSFLTEADRLWLAAAMVALLSAFPLRADPILSVSIDDPQGVFTPYPDGISVTEINNVASLKSSPVSSGVGASVFLDMDTVEWKEGGETPKTVKFVKEAGMGAKGFLRVINETQMPGTKGFIRVVPDNVGTSLAALSRVENGKILFDGGFDMFFRFEEDPPGKPFQAPNLVYSQGGIEFLIEADYRGGVTAALWDPKKEAIFDTDLDGKPNADRVEATLANSVPVDPGVIYHLAVAFSTAPDGTVTLKVFLKSGTGAINTAEDTALVCKASFRAFSENPGKSLSEDAIRFYPHSRHRPPRVTFDLAAFRIFKPAPKSFPDLSGKG